MKALYWAHFLGFIFLNYKVSLITSALFEVTQYRKADCVWARTPGAQSVSKSSRGLEEDQRLEAWCQKLGRVCVEWGPNILEQWVPPSLHVMAQLPLVGNSAHVGHARWMVMVAHWGDSSLYTACLRCLLFNIACCKSSPCKSYPNGENLTWFISLFIQWAHDEQLLCVEHCSGCF